ncbi:hypothetical protein GGX14DRAFT_389509 [Mycena pura]|uniref:Uncharacterized protein n=1 Tax=Mycena pura TaxID=153505 RepID=A0AAD6YGC1_9AGAR|nr:hypothetical protein GGX14DRAFT_389509 [Mycena pura]
MHVSLGPAVSPAEEKLKKKQEPQGPIDRYLKDESSGEWGVWHVGGRPRFSPTQTESSKSPGVKGRMLPILQSRLAMGSGASRHERRALGYAQPICYAEFRQRSKGRGLGTDESESESEETKQDSHRNFSNTPVHHCLPTPTSSAASNRPAARDLVVEVVEAHKVGHLQTPPSADRQTGAFLFILCTCKFMEFKHYVESLIFRVRPGPSRRSLDLLRALLRDGVSPLAAPAWTRTESSMLSSATLILTDIGANLALIPSIT